MAQKVTTGLMPQKMRDDELFAHEVESVRSVINANADELAATTAAVVDAPTTAAEYVSQGAGKTLWRLGSAIRDKTKLRLQKFSAGTLPALLPAPVLAADRPGLPAPGAGFPLSPLIGGVAPGPAAIAEYTRTVADGNHVVLSGSDLDRAQYPVYQNGYFYAATVSSQSESEAAVRLPRVGAAFDAALCWAWTGAGLSVPVVLNTARVKWEQDVWAPGLTINIFGENLAQGNVEGGAGWVAIQQGSGPVRLYNLNAANPYRAAFTVPATVTPGKLSYWYHNGHGGEHGWSAKRTVDVVATAAHVLTRNFGQPTRAVLLDASDASLNVSRIRDAYQAVAQAGGGTFSTPAGSFPLNDTIQPKDGVRWVCDSVATGGVTTLTAATWVGTGNLGMFGSNFWIGGALDGLEFIKTSGVKLADAEAVVVLNNIDQVQLRRTKARWNEPYDTRQAGPVREALPAQPLRLGTSKNVFFDDLTMTGSGINLGGSSNVFFTNYTHRATHNADYMLYSNNMLGWCMIGYDLRDLDPTSTDGADRGIRCIKSGGQNGRNRYRHLENGIGTDLGIVRSGTNQAPDDNQFEQDLDEYNITKYADKVVRATAATVTIPRTLITQVNGQPEYLLKPDQHLVVIAAGRGAGQWRGIVSTTTDTITVDEPWLVVPDATSVLHTGWFSTDSTRYNVHYTGKPDNAQNPLYNHSSFYNGFGGVRGGIIDKCSGDGFRQGISFVATQHDATMVDQTAFNVVRNSRFPRSRWGRRFEAMPGQTGWAFDVPGLYCNLFSNCTYEAAIVAPLVYQLPRDTAGQVPGITMLVEENQPIDVGLNDFSPTFYNDPLYPPKAVIPGTLTNSRQLVRQALSVIGAPGTLLLAGGELGPLEPLPAGSVLDTFSGMLTIPGVDAALLVFVDGAQLAPLARTAAANTSTTPTPGAPGDTYTKPESDARYGDLATQQQHTQQLSTLRSNLVGQHTTFDGARVTGPIQFRGARPAGLQLTAISNVAMVAMQVNYRDVTRDGIWVAGMVHTSAGSAPADLATLLAEVEADIAAVPAPALALAAEVLLRTQPVDATLESDFFLDGLRGGNFFGRSIFFRTTYTGPPIGNVVLNPQFRDASAWAFPYGGGSVGNGQLNLSGRADGDHYVKCFQFQTVQADTYTIELAVLQLDKGSLTLQIAGVGQWSVFAPGTYTYTGTLATSQQIEIYLSTFDSGILVSHLYMTPM